MKKILIYLLLVCIPIVCVADGHLTEDQKKKTIECAGIYYANSMIPQAELELEKIHNDNIKEFKKIEDDLKEQENLVLSQKNILSKD